MLRLELHRCTVSAVTEAPQQAGPQRRVSSMGGGPARALRDARVGVQKKVGRGSLCTHEKLARLLGKPGASGAGAACRWLCRAPLTPARACRRP